jgi:hypothetical protein
LLLDLLAQMVTPWGFRPIKGDFEWPSHIGDDHTPIELSLTMESASELRLIVEPVADAPSLESNRDAAFDLLAQLSSRFPIAFERLDLVRDIFCPPDPHGPFSVWVAAAVPDKGPPTFKLYLNPSARGANSAPALVREALGRLGLSRAWPVVERSLLRRGADVDTLAYFSLDLERSPEARVKVYARHQNSTPGELEAVARASTSHVPGDVISFLSALAPGATRFDGRAPSTCLTFLGSHDAGAAAATTHFPVNNYATDDRAIEERTRSLLVRLGIDPQPYARAVAAFAKRPLDAGAGMHSYVSFRRYRSEPRVTAYFALEAYEPRAVASAVKMPSAVPSRPPRGPSGMSS